MEIQYYNTLESNFGSIICQVVAYEKLKTKENFKLFAVKVITVINKKWTLTRDSNYSNLTRKLSVFWKTGHQGVVEVW